MNFATQSMPTFRRRITALLIDYLVILGWMAVLGLISLIIYVVRGSYPDLLGLLGPLRLEALFFTILTLPVVVYHFCTEAGPRHATIGKRVLGLRVQSLAGGPPSRGQIARRTVIKFLPWELAHFFILQLQWRSGHPDGPGVLPTWVSAGLVMTYLVPLGYGAIVAFSRRHRGPHDFVAGTSVQAVALAHDTSSDPPLDDSDPLRRRRARFDRPRRVGGLRPNSRSRPHLRRGLRS